MRSFVKALAAVFLVAAPASAFEWGVKAGVGTLFDPAQYGGHVSIEMPLSEEYPTLLNAFGEYYRRSETDTFVDANSGNTISADITGSQTLIGLGIMYKAGFSESGGTVFFSAGGGLMRGDGDITYSDGSPSPTISADNAGMITVGAGLMFHAAESVAIYGQVRLFRNWASTGTKNNVVGANVGVHIPIGR